MHARPGVAVSATKQGLIIVDQSSMHLYGEVGVHDFEGFAEGEDEVPRILRDLGDKHCLIMWNHGLLAIGRTIAEAFLYMRRLVDACELQIQLMSMGTEIRHIPKDVLEVTREQIVEKRKDAALRPGRVGLPLPAGRAARSGICGVGWSLGPRTRVSASRRPELLNRTMLETRLGAPGSSAGHETSPRLDPRLLDDLAVERDLAHHALGQHVRPAADDLEAGAARARDHLRILERGLRLGREPRRRSPSASRSVQTGRRRCR